ncbi:ATPase [Aurantiacibacter spongiae]|uniref:ATPase n=1 Tax=Aurantiacibacter spongiae TaxID=2488860 RepID=A0A3N5D811_9SPHN|nr:ATPase [Aurantiacibacter spongiae]RPF70708.1 ATPase [Aurantiacibacter spongiae]
MVLRKLPVLPAVLALSVPATPVRAEVVEASDGGFATRSEAVVRLPRDDVWLILKEPARWWNGAHSWSADAGNLSLDARAGGCFCEALPNRGSVEHARVINAAPGAMLRMKGALGPLRAEPVDGVLTVMLEPTGEDTRIVWTYVVGGYSRISFEQVAPAVAGVMAEQLARLVNLIERGSPHRGRGNADGGDLASF